MKKLFKNQIIWLIAILVLGIAVRLYRIDFPLADWHSWRQADTASVSRNFLERGVEFFSPKYHDVSSIQSGIFNPRGYRLVELPVYNLFHFLYAKILPVSFEVAGRLVSTTAWLVSTVMIYFLGKRFGGKYAGVFSALFFAFIPFNIYFTRVILPEPLIVTFLLISIWTFSKYIDEEKNKHFFLSAVFFALAMLLKPYILFFGLAHAYLAFEKFGAKNLTNSKLFIKNLLFGAIVIIPFLFWRIQINLYPAGIPFFEWAFNGDGIRFRPAFWRWLAGERLAKLILGYWGLVPFALGFVKKSRKNLFNLFFFLGGLIYMTVVATANVRHDYYQIFMVPSIALLAGSGSSMLWNSKFLNKYPSRILLCFSVAMMLLMGWYQVKDYYQINHPEIIEAGEAVNELVEKDAWVVAPYNGDTAFLYHTKRWGWPAVDDSIEMLIKRGADYYVSVNLGDSDTSMLKLKYKTLKETPKYIIIDLKAPLK